jgi:glycogen operon protein
LSHPIFHQPHFFKGHDLRGIGMKDLTWINPDGSEMTDEAWNTGYAKVMGLMLCGDAMNLYGPKGEPITDGTFLLFFNAHHEAFEVGMPGHINVRWRLVIDTADEAGFVANGAVYQGGSRHMMEARSFALFELQGGTVEEARDVRGRRTGNTRPPIDVAPAKKEAATTQRTPAP